jgi:hypothetical protein
MNGDGGAKLRETAQRFWTEIWRKDVNPLIGGFLALIYFAKIIFLLIPALCCLSVHISDQIIESTRRPTDRID